MKRYYLTFMSLLLLLAFGCKEQAIETSSFKLENKQVLSEKDIKSIPSFAKSQAQEIIPDSPIDNKKVMAAVIRSGFQGYSMVRGPQFLPEHNREWQNDNISGQINDNRATSSKYFSDDVNYTSFHAKVTLKIQIQHDSISEKDKIPNRGEKIFKVFSWIYIILASLVGIVIILASADEISLIIMFLVSLITVFAILILITKYFVKILTDNTLDNQSRRRKISKSFFIAGLVALGILIIFAIGSSLMASSGIFILYIISLILGGIVNVLELFCPLFLLFALIIFLIYFATKNSQT